MEHAPVHRLKKDEIVWLASHKCEHKHSYLTHYNCYLKENPSKAKVGYLDIETSNLDADFGIVFCYCIKEHGVNKILGSVVTAKEVVHDTQPDKRLVTDCIKDMEKFDTVFTYYGTKFDIPFLRTRAVSMGLCFPYFGSIKHKDVYYIIKNKFKLHRRRLEVACNELLGGSHKTHFDGNVWRQAVQGKKEALGYIYSHCEADVRDLEALTNKVIDFAYPQTKSI